MVSMYTRGRRISSKLTSSRSEYTCEGGAAYLLQEVEVPTPEVLVSGPGGGGLGAGQSVARVGAHKTLLVEDSALAAEEREVAGHDLVEDDVGETHVEDGAVIGLVRVVAVGEVSAVEARPDVAQDKRGVGREAVERGRGVPAWAWV